MMLKQPAFWWKKSGLIAYALLPVSWGIGFFSTRKLRRRPEMIADVPVICVGNFTMGGAGKTPTALAVAELVNELGKTPVFLSRGYRGKLSGPVLVDPERHVSADIGDEPLLLAGVAPTIVAKEKPAGAKLAMEKGADVIIMDDGFQNAALGKSLSLMVVDAATGVGNRMVMPAGPLRAPLDAQLELTDAVIILGNGLAAGTVRVAASALGITTTNARLKPLNGADFKDRKVLAFAGIGRPKKFFATLKSCGAEIASRHAFADHHRYGEADATRLMEKADANGLTLVTTEKDHARLAGAQGPMVRQLHDRCEVLRVACRFKDRKSVSAMIAAVLDGA